MGVSHGVDDDLIIGAELRSKQDDRGNYNFSTVVFCISSLNRL